MTLDSRFHIRHYAPEADLAPLARTLAEVEAVDHDGEDASEAALREALTWPNYRPDQDVWVAEAGGRLVGYGVTLAQPSRRCTIYVVAHPAWRRLGLGSALLELTLGRARETGSQIITIYANAQNAAANAFLRQRGFTVAGDSWIMRASADGPTPDVQCPPGFTLRRYAEAPHLPTLIEIVNQSYRGMWGHGQYSEATATEATVNSSYLARYGAEGIFMLFAPDGRVVGFCGARPQARRDERGGELTDLLDAPGVVQEYRSQGLQRPLVAAALRWLRAEGQRPITLDSYGDDEQAIAIYREAGFDLVQHYVAWRFTCPV